MTFDEAGELLDRMAEEFPEEFYADLNGGISLLPDEMPDPEFPPGEMYILGEYCDDQMGKYILLYYGSFAALAAKEEWTEADTRDLDQIVHTLYHIMTAHIPPWEGRN